MTEYLTIGVVAERCGVATSALRFYESKGLITSTRTDGNQRRFPRSTIRVVSVIRAAQVGVRIETGEAADVFVSLLACLIVPSVWTFFGPGAKRPEADGEAEGEG